MRSFISFRITINLSNVNPDPDISGQGDNEWGIMPKIYSKKIRMNYPSKDVFLNNNI